MSKYENAKIYKVVGACGGIYIGATCTSLKERLWAHNDTRNKASSKLLSKPLTIELIEEFPCDDVIQLNSREGYWIRKYPECVNRQMPDKNPHGIGLPKKEQDAEYYKFNKPKILAKVKEYYENHREEKLSYANEYYEKNKQIMIQCECGSEIVKTNLSVHKRSIKHKKWEETGKKRTLPPLIKEQRGRYGVDINRKEIRKWLGTFDTIEEAVQKRDEFLAQM